MKRCIVLGLLVAVTIPSLVQAGFFGRRRGCVRSECVSYVAPVYVQPTPVVQAVATVNVTPAVPAYQPGWKEKLIDYKAYKADLDAYLKAIGEVENVGNNYVNYQGGSTVYGYTPYTYQQVAQLYGNVDLNVLYQQADRQTTNAQELAREGASEFKGLVNLANAGHARFAETLAKGLSAEKALKASEATGAASVTTTIQGAVPTQLPVPAPTPVAGQTDHAAALAAWQQSSQRCVACHSGAKLSGGYDVTKFPSAPTQGKDGKLDVISRLMSSDAKSHMPRKADGVTPGDTIPTAELSAWLALVN